METLKHKVAVVTGGTSGIGYATARELKQQEATVVITGRRKEAVDRAAEELGVTGLVSDQGSLEAIEGLTESIAGRFNKIDILVINAGVLATTSIESATADSFDYVMGINLRGAYFTLSRFIPLLNEGASVVFISSNTASMNGAHSSIYSSSKAALNAVMKIAAVELAARGIRVNAVSPGPTETDILKKQGFDDEQLKGLTAWMIDQVPLRRIGKAQDVGKLVAYLSGAASAFITGAEFLLDGGMSL